MGNGMSIGSSVENNSPDMPHKLITEKKILTPVSGKVRQIFRLRKNSSLTLGCILLCIILGAAIFCPYLTPYDPISVDLSKALSPPNRYNLLGTDNVGRDV